MVTSSVHRGEYALSVLKKDREMFEDLKRENGEYRKKTLALKKNNDKLVELVAALYREVKRFKEELSQRYEYHFEKGGWEEKGALDAGRIVLRKRDPDVQEINTQLDEILRMLKRHAKE